MARDDVIKSEGTVVKVLRDRLCLVELANGHRLLAHGKPNKPVNGDGDGWQTGQRVWLNLSPFDLSTGKVRSE